MRIASTTMMETKAPAQSRKVIVLSHQKVFVHMQKAGQFNSHHSYSFIRNSHSTEGEEGGSVSKLLITITRGGTKDITI